MLEVTGMPFKFVIGFLLIFVNFINIDSWDLWLKFLEFVAL